MSNALELNAGNFEAEVLQSGTPVLVDFWAGWCMPCKMLAPVVDELASEFAGRIKVAKVDVDKNQDLAEKFAIRGIPALLIFDKGKEVERLVGVQSKSAISAKITALTPA
jgi:thioredoxin 1